MTEGSFRGVRRVCFGVRVLGGAHTTAGPDDWTIVDGDDPLALWAVVQEVIGDGGAPRSVEVRRLSLYDMQPSPGDEPPPDGRAA